MMIEINAELEVALQESAKKKGMSAEALARQILGEKLKKNRKPFEPQADWEKLLMSAASDCGVSPPNSAFTRDELYD